MRKSFIRRVGLSILMTCSPLAVLADTWIRIEAHPTALQAIARAESLDDTFDNISVFSIQSGWFAIALGPYADAQAPAVLRQLRSTRQIPGDAFLAAPSDFGARIWLRAGASDQPVATSETAATPIVSAEETPAEARRSELQLTREEREHLQEALQWAGFYNSGIDGAFGPGTRRAMADWQAASGFEATGVMSTAQRQQLIADYEGFMASLGMQYVYDREAGIEIELPMTMLAFERYDPPFAVYRGKTDPDLQVLLISQEGSRATLAGLYEVMQTLKIMPLDGPRGLNQSSFRLAGSNDSISTQSFAQLSDGQIKGFVLVWPTGDAKRQDYIFKAMSESFRIDSAYVLPDFVEGQTEQAIDLLAGLEIRKPAVTASGFFVDSRGSFLTSAHAVQGCDAITIEDDRSAQVVATDDALGVALLRPDAEAAPVGWARFSDRTASIGSSIALSGFSFGGRLDAPSVTFGTLEDTSDLDGNADRVRISVAAYDGDIGGPVLNDQGQVVGMLLQHPDGQRMLPENVHFAASAGAIAALLAEQNVSITLSEDSARQDTLAMEAVSADMTVNVACWK